MRVITVMAIFFLTMNLFAGTLMSTGVGDMLGVSTEVGGDEEIDQATNESDEISSGSPTGSTLFGMYNVLASGLSTILVPVTAGPTMLSRAGLPTEITFGIIQPVILIVYALGIMSFLRGWGLI